MDSITAAQPSASTPQTNASASTDKLYIELDKLGLSHLYDNFKHQKINYDLFLTLKWPTVERYFPHLAAGDALVLKEYLERTIKPITFKVSKRTLGEGRFGRVYEGKMNDRRVALKSISQRTIEEKERAVLAKTQ